MKDINGGHRGYECTGREFDDEKYEPHNTTHSMLIDIAKIVGLIVYAVMICWGIAIFIDWVAG